MNGAWEIVFWSGFLIILYTYAGYPLLVFMMTVIKRTFRASGSYVATFDELPQVTLIITAYNEAGVIDAKIKNTLALDYPFKKLTIVCITDGSTDGTDLIAAEFREVTVLHQPVRRGKLAAMNRAIQTVQSAIVVFSDANSFLNAAALRLLVAHFADAKVGAVSGEKKIRQAGDAVGRGEGIYWRYESLLKRMDSQLKTVVGAAGELLALRRALYTQLPANIIIEDFVQSMLICTRGYVVRYEPAAYAVEESSAGVRDEMERKVRISAGGFQAMAFLAPTINMFKQPLLFFQYVSHRVLRWTLCPLALPMVFLSAFALSINTHGIFYGVMAALQAVFYGAAAVGWHRASSNKRSGPFYLPFYFTFMHMCVYAGFRRYLRGKQSAVWQKAGR